MRKTAKTKLVKFSKPSAAVLKYNQSLFEDNNAILARQKRLAKLYKEQPMRATCKNCGGHIGKPLFVKMGVPYSMCAHCHHLNGAYEDTDAYCRVLYTNDGGERYSLNYNEKTREAYAERVKDIYAPKAKFLIDALKAQGQDATKMHYADFGAGAGYFVAGLIDSGLSRAIGYEVSAKLVNLAKDLRPDIQMCLHELHEILNLAKNVKADVVSMIGVLEHVQNPRKVLAALRDNPHVKYLYLLVPMFSPSVFIECAFPNVAQRILSNEHTHLYTEKSIEYLCKEFGLTTVGEWWFGADSMDLYRSLAVTIAKEPANESARNTLAEMMMPLIDPVQAQIDQRKNSSEVHILLSFDKK